MKYRRLKVLLTQSIGTQIPELPLQYLDFFTSREAFMKRLFNPNVSFLQLRYGKL